MPDTPDTQQLRGNVLDWLKEQKLDPEDLAAQTAAIRNMSFAELAVMYPECTSDLC